MAKKTSKKPAAKKKPAKAAKKPAKAAKKPAAKRAAKVEAVPKRYGTVTPHIIVSPCAEAIAFYVKAFGAKHLASMPGPGDIIVHAEIQIGDSIIMLSDEMPPMPGSTGMPRKAPRSAGATTAGVHLYVPDTDALFARAVAAGAKPSMPPMDQFWGDRYAQIEDPFGQVWAIATHKKDMTLDEMRAAGDAFMKSFSPSAAA